MIYNAYVVSGLVTGSYFSFYTAYDKTKKVLVLQNLIDLVTLNRGLDWTLVEINKAISLSGLTTLLLGFLPHFKDQSKELIWISMNLLWTHSIYSFYKVIYTIKSPHLDYQIAFIPDTKFYTYINITVLSV